MKQIAYDALLLAKELEKIAPTTFVPPSGGNKPKNQTVLPHSIVSGTRGYIERVVFQINGCYENGWFDGCAVMMRRLIETLVIECFESHGISNNIKDSNTGEYLHLRDLISITLNEPSWNLGRDTKKILPKLKEFGDRAAHNRRYNAHREDIDKLSTDFRMVCQEFIYLSKLK